MAALLKFGDLVLCGLEGAPAGAGLLAELRKTDARVWYLEQEKNLWSPHASLKPAPPARTEGTLERLVAELLEILGGLELEFSRLPGKESYRLIVSHGPIAPEALDRLRARLGADLLACRVRPQGMHRIQTIVEFPAASRRAASGRPPAP